MALVHLGHLGTVAFTATLTPGTDVADDRETPNPNQLMFWELHAKRKMSDVTPFAVTQEVWVPGHVMYWWRFNGFIERETGGGVKAVEFHKNTIQFKLTPDSDTEPGNYFIGDGFVEDFKLRGQIGDLQRFECIVRGSPRDNKLSIEGW